MNYNIFKQKDIETESHANEKKNIIEENITYNDLKTEKLNVTHMKMNKKERVRET